MSFRCETSDDDDGGGDDDDDDEEVDVRDGDGDDDDLWCLSLHVQSCRIKMSSRMRKVSEGIGGWWEGKMFG